MVETVVVDGVGRIPVVVIDGAGMVVVVCEEDDVVDTVEGDDGAVTVVVCVVVDVG